MRRVREIDNLRGLAILTVIFMHTFSLVKTGLAHLVWDLVHFTVPMLMFCSGFSLFLKYERFKGNPL